jgi:carboxyl-terminal processing protease
VDEPKLEASVGINPFDTQQFQYTPQRNEQNSHPPTYAAQGVAQILVTAVLVVVAFAAGWFGNGYVNRANTATGDQQLVLQAWNDINQYYVVTGAINQKQMAYDAINAIVNSLGDTGHSRFETPEQLAQEQQQLQNAPTTGIGVYLSGGGSQPIRIDAIIPNSPASKVNLKPGDWIVGVNGTDVRGKTIDQVRPMISGAKGTTVTLTIIRPSVSTTATFQVPIVRGEFSAPTVVSYIIPGTGIDDIQLLQFSSDAGSQLQQALKDAQAQHVKGIILDLRDDPGGYLDQSVAVASQFIPYKPGENVLIEKSRTSQQAQPVQKGGLATTIPLAILVNNGTASAAEITAGAIQVDRPGVNVVGETTFGTGTVLQELMLSDGSALWLGTQEWLLPNGQSIYHKGYTPNQQVALPSNVAPVSALVASEEHLTQQQVLGAGDAQLVQAYKDLTGAQG